MHKCMKLPSIHEVNFPLPRETIKSSPSPNWIHHRSPTSTRGPKADDEQNKEHYTLRSAH